MREISVNHSKYRSTQMSVHMPSVIPAKAGIQAVSEESHAEIMRNLQ